MGFVGAGPRERETGQRRGESLGGGDQGRVDCTDGAGRVEAVSDWLITGGAPWRRGCG